MNILFTICAIGISAFVITMIFYLMMVLKEYYEWSD